MYKAPPPSPPHKNAGVGDDVAIAAPPCLSHMGTMSGVCWGFHTPRPLQQISPGGHCLLRLPRKIYWDWLRLRALLAVTASWSPWRCFGAKSLPGKGSCCGTPGKSSRSNLAWQILRPGEPMSSKLGSCLEMCHLAQTSETRKNTKLLKLSFGAGLLHTQATCCHPGQLAKL